MTSPPIDVGELQIAFTPLVAGGWQFLPRGYAKSIRALQLAPARDRRRFKLSSVSRTRRFKPHVVTRSRLRVGTTSGLVDGSPRPQADRWYYLRDFV